MACKGCEPKNPNDILAELDEEVRMENEEVKEEKKSLFKKEKENPGCSKCGGLFFHWNKRLEAYTCDHCKHPKEKTK